MKTPRNGTAVFTQVYEDSDCEDYPTARTKRFSLLRGVLYALGITAVVLSIVLGVFYGVRG